LRIDAGTDGSDTGSAAINEDLGRLVRKVGLVRKIDRERERERERERGLTRSYPWKKLMI
jgi:hypothetical protein